MSESEDGRGSDSKNAIHARELAPVLLFGLIGAIWLVAGTTTGFFSLGQALALGLGAIAAGALCVRYVLPLGDWRVPVIAASVGLPPPLLFGLAAKGSFGDAAAFCPPYTLLAVVGIQLGFSILRKDGA